MIFGPDLDMTTGAGLRITVSNVGNGHRLGNDFLVRAVTLLKDIRGVNIDVIESDIPSHFFINASASILEVLSTVSLALSSASKTREAEVVEYIIAKCNDTKPFGGLGLSDTSISEESERNDVLFLLESWLTALNSQDHVNKGPSPVARKLGTVRPMTLAEKILAQHTVGGCPVEGVRAGDVVRVALDWVIASELTWTVSKSKKTSDV
jgi:hypothetical protein